jgi:hypothetical protein
MHVPTIRALLLEIVNQHAGLGPGSQQQSTILGALQRRIEPTQTMTASLQQDILTVWYDLFRTGYLAWGADLGNPDPPFYHLTRRGQEAIQRLERDPSNPEGYLRYLHAHAVIGAIADSYLIEALQAYDAECYKAAAVLVGIAAESIILDLRDALLLRMRNLHLSPSAKLTQWLIKTVVDAMDRELHPRLKDMPKELQEAYASYWPSLTGHIRSLRNDAGHPNSIAPVSIDEVRAALLLFPDLAHLATALQTWIATSFRALLPP